MKRIAVIGGGVTGLAAAHRLVELALERSLDLEVRLLEAGPRIGGIIGTERRDGFTLELGPDSIITDKPWGMALTRRLGLEEQLIGTNTEYRRAFVVREGQLVPVPEGFQILAPSRFDTLAESPLFSWGGKCRMLQDLTLPAAEGDADESLGAFVVRRLGQEVLDRIAGAMVAGIYGADPMELSLLATFPRFREMEREHGSVIRGMWARAEKAASRQEGVLGPGASAESPQAGTSGARYGLFVSFRDGMQTLTDALAARLPEGCVSLNTAVERLEPTGGGWRLALSGGAYLDADGVALALPSYRSAALLQDVGPDLAARLEAIPYASAATMSLCYRRDEIPHPLNGFGFVVPQGEGLSILGCTFTGVKYAYRVPEGYSVLRAFLGHEVSETCDEGEMERRVREDFRRLLGVTARPRFVLTWRGRACMPQYRVGHLDRVAEIERLSAVLPGLELAGNAYRGVGIPDSIHSGESAAERLLALAET